MSDGVKVTYMTGGKATRDEWDCTINFGYRDDKISVFTSIPSIIHKLEKRGWDKTEEVRYEDESIFGCGFEGPKNGLTFRDVSKSRKKEAKNEKD